MTVEKQKYLWKLINDGDYCVVGSKLDRLESEDILSELEELLRYYQAEEEGYDKS